MSQTFSFSEMRGASGTLFRKRSEKARLSMEATPSQVGAQERCLSASGNRDPPPPKGTLLQNRATWPGPPTDPPPEFEVAEPPRWHVGADVKPQLTPHLPGLFLCQTGPRGNGNTEKSIGKTFSPRRSHTHLHTTTIRPPPSRCDPRSRSPFPQASPQPCHVSCCPSRHGTEAQSWGPRNGVSRHTWR